MKTLKVTYFHISPEGYGHWKITIDVYDISDPTIDYQREQYSHTTSNMPLIDRIRGAEDGDEDAANARVTASELTLERNGIEYDGLIMDSIYK